MRFEFEWALINHGDGTATIHERLAGTDLLNIYGPLPIAVAHSTIKARRSFVNRTITSRTTAIQIFEPRPQLEALKLLQKKGHLDS